ncbi:MAG: permease prefix domain 1-containing protein, partial [Bacteroidota bacterium]
MPFRLDPALAAWERSLRFRRALSQDDRRELAAHVRDHLDALLADGLSEEEAFHHAIRAVGDLGQAETEYGKVYWEKAVHRRTLRHELTARLAMLKNYLTVAVRTLRKAKGYAAINVVGLAVGLACCLLIALLVRHEWSYDRFHVNLDRLY